MSSVVEEITGLPINYITLLTLDEVKEVIDNIGGVDVNVANGFSDELYPRDDVDPTIGDPELLYETVRFSAGLQHFDGSTAVKFMRSRHSDDDLEGSDEGRRARQQLVVMSLMDAIQDKTIWLDPKKSGNLFAYWNESFEESIPISELASILWNMDDHDVTFNTLHIPITDEDHQGLLTVVKENSHGQWVYEPVDPTWNQLQQWIDDNLSK